MLFPAPRITRCRWQRVSLSPGPRQHARDLRPAPCHLNEACLEPETEKKGCSACNCGKPSVLTVPSRLAGSSASPTYLPVHLENLLKLPVDPTQGPLPPASQPAPSPHLTSLSRPHSDEETSPHPDKRTTPPGFPLSLPAPPIPNQTSRALQGTVVWGKGSLLEGKGGWGFQEPPPLLPQTGKLSR